MKRITLLVIFCLTLVSCQNAKNVTEEKETLSSEELKIEITKKEHTLIYFWTTWCGPCRKTIKELLPALERSIDTSKVQLLVVAVSKNDKQIKDILSTSRLTSKKLKLDFTGPDIYLNHKFALKNTLEKLFVNEKVWRNSVPVFALVNKRGEVVNAHLPKDLDKLLAILNNVMMKEDRSQVSVLKAANEYQ